MSDSTVSYPSPASKVISVTGHRPEKLGGYEIKATKQVLYTARRALELLRPDSVITGMAMGWDMAIAQACVDLQIPFTAAIPFRGQESRWSKGIVAQYNRLLQESDHIHVVSEGGYNPYKMILRNHWMVDNSDKLLSLYNGDKEGGTAECVKYAIKQKKEIVNTWRIFQNQSDTLTLIEV